MPINIRTKLAILEWLASGPHGQSAETMAVFLAEIPTQIHHPADVGDFYRCLRFLSEFPEARKRLLKMARVSPQWAALVRRWGEIEAIWQDETGERRGFPKTSALIQEILAETWKMEGGIRSRAVQCSCKAGTDGYCKQHSPTAQAEKDAVKDRERRMAVVRNRRSADCAAITEALQALLPEIHALPDQHRDAFFERADDRRAAIDAKAEADIAAIREEA